MHTYKILESDEVVQEDSRIIASGSSSTSPSSVHFVQNKQGSRQAHGYKGSMQTSMEVKQGKPTLGKCFDCGVKDHRAKSASCPAKHSPCHFCHKNGHWESVCFAKQRSLAAAKLHQVSNLEDSREPELHCIQSMLKAVSKSSANSAQFSGMIHIRDSHTGKVNDLTEEIDSGSCCSIISCHFFDEKLPSIHLWAIQHPSFTFGGTLITGFKGTFSTVISANGRECSVHMVVCTAGIIPLIGYDIINGLELTFTGSSTVASIDSSTPTKGVSTVSSPEQDISFQH